MTKNYCIFLIYIALVSQFFLLNTPLLAQTGNTDNEVLEKLRNEIFSQADVPPEDALIQLGGSNPFDVDHNPLPRKEKVTEGENQPLQNDKSMLFVAMVLSLTLLAITIGDNKKTFRRLIRALNNSNYLKLFYRDSKSNYPAMLMVLYLFAFISLSIFLYLILEYKEIGTGWESKFLLLGGIFFIVCFLLLFKHLFLSFLSYVFPLGKELKLYSFSMMLAMIAAGIFLAPVNAVIAFGDESYIKTFIYIGFVVIIFFYSFQQFRGILYGSRYLLYNTFHFFLYICTVELLPIALIAKLISNFSL